MKTDDNKIEDLFEAAKRHHKNLRRQQHLSQLVDQWEAEELAAKSTARHRKLWISLSIAASILLLVSVAIRSLQPRTSVPSNTIVAENRTTSMPVPHEPPTVVATPPHSSTSTSAPIVSSAPQATSTHNSTAEPQEPLVAQSNVPADNDINQVQSNQILIAENTITPPINKPKRTVYERTSSRLIGKSGYSKAETIITSDLNQPLLAFSCPSNNIQYEIGRIEF